MAVLGLVLCTEEPVSLRRSTHAGFWLVAARATGCFDLVLANISSAAVIELLPAAAAALRPEGLLVASGFLGERACEVEAASAAAGLVTREVVHDGEWCALVAAREAG